MAQKQIGAFGQLIAVESSDSRLLQKLQRGIVTAGLTGLATTISSLQAVAWTGADGHSIFPSKTPRVSNPESSRSYTNTSKKVGSS